MGLKFFQRDLVAGAVIGGVVHTIIGILSLWRGNGSSVSRYFHSLALLDGLEFCACDCVCLFSLFHGLEF